MAYAHWYNVAFFMCDGVLVRCLTTKFAQINLEDM